MIRFVEKADVPRLTAIYNHYIKNTTVTFEINPLTEEEFEARVDAIVGEYPYLVFEEDGVLLGYAYFAAFNPRAAYRCTADLSIYLADEARGRGAGARLYKALEALAGEYGIRNVISIITEENVDSLRFHEKMGFTQAADFPDIAEKFGRRLGVKYYIRRL